MVTDKLKVAITNEQKEYKIPSGIRLLIRRCCHAVLQAEQMRGHFEVSVSFVDDERILELNSQFRGKDLATDVLSFPSGTDGNFPVDNDSGAALLGDIALSIPHVYNQAEQYGHDIRREFAYLTVHAMLHLLGYDHEGNGIDRVRMREKEEDILNRLGLARGASYVHPQGR